jgi:hypothetical protein
MDPVIRLSTVRTGLNPYIRMRIRIVSSNGSMILEDEIPIIPILNYG